MHLLKIEEFIVSFLSSSNNLYSCSSQSHLITFPPSGKLEEAVWKIVTGKQSQQQVIAGIDRLQVLAANDPMQGNAGSAVLDPFAICAKHDISLLQYAINAEMEEVVAYFLRPHECFSSEQTDAFLAARAEKIDVCEEVGRNTALHLACRGKQSRIVGMLLEAGASVYNRNCRNETPLYISACTGDVESLSLIARCAKGNTEYLNAGVNRLGMTALHQACSRGDVASARILIEAGADVNVQHLDGATPLHFAAEQGMTEAVEILMGESEFPTALIKCTELLQDRSALHLASMHGHTECARRLIQLGAPIDARDRSGLTPLHYAAEQGKSNAVWMLIQEGADFSLPFFEETFLDCLAKKTGALDHFLRVSHFWLNNLEEIEDPSRLVATLELQHRLVRYIGKQLYGSLPRAVKQIATATLVLPMKAALTGPQLKNSFDRELGPVFQKLGGAVDPVDNEEALLHVLTEGQRSLVALQVIARNYFADVSEVAWMADWHAKLEMALLELTMRRLNVLVPSSSSEESPSPIQKSTFKRPQRSQETGSSQGAAKRTSFRSSVTESTSASRTAVARAKRTEMSNQVPTSSSSEGRDAKRNRTLRTEGEPIHLGESFDLAKFGITLPDSH